MNNKQSSIDFMHDAFMEVLGRKRPMTSNEVAKIWLQAKATHKEEIMKANDAGYEDAMFLSSGRKMAYKSAEHYYTQKFGGKR